MILFYPEYQRDPETEFNLLNCSLKMFTVQLIHDTVHWCLYWKPEHINVTPHNSPVVQKNVDIIHLFLLEFLL